MSDMFTTLFASKTTNEHIETFTQRIKHCLERDSDVTDVGDIDLACEDTLFDAISIEDFVILFVDVFKHLSSIYQRKDGECECDSLLLNIVVSGLSEVVVLNARELFCVYLPIACVVIDERKNENRNISSSTPLLVGIAGPAACGKSVFSEILRLVIDSVLHLKNIGVENVGSVVSASMDGYHFPNAYLEANSLMKLKGAPNTIDVAALMRDLRRVKQLNGNDSVELPYYNRQTHEPEYPSKCKCKASIDNCNCNCNLDTNTNVTARTPIVIIEGLYMLLDSDEWSEWRGVSRLLDFSISLRVAMETCRTRVIARKVAGGRSLEDATRHFEAVDMVVYRMLLSRKNIRGGGGGGSVECVWNEELKMWGCQYKYKYRMRRQLEPEQPSLSLKNVGITVIGLNPAFQKTLDFTSEIKKGEVNRSVACLNSVGGKGQQFARAAGRLISSSSPSSSSVHLCQFLGGDTGRAIESQLVSHSSPTMNVGESVGGGVDEKEGKGKEGNKIKLKLITEWTEALTRTCITLNECIETTTAATATTEIIEPSGMISESERDSLMKKIGKVVGVDEGEGSANCSCSMNSLAICGTFPPGIEPSFYVDVMNMFKGSSSGSKIECGIRFSMFDGTKGAFELLETGKIDILKINKSELFSIVTSMQDEDEKTMKMEFSLSLTVPSACFRLHSVYSVGYIAVTDGPSTAYLIPSPSPSSTSKLYYKYTIPDLGDKLVNPIGAGDTVGAVTLCIISDFFNSNSNVHLSHSHSLSMKTVISEAYRYGLAAGSASCLLSGGADYEMDDVYRLLGQIDVRICHYFSLL